MNGSSAKPEKSETTSQDEVTARLLDAAQALFVAQGVNAVSMEAVAKAARASKRTLYARFPSKADLVGAVAARLYEDLRQRLSELPDDLELEEFLRGFAAGVLEALTQEQMKGFLRLVISEAVIQPDFARAVLEAGKLPATQVLVSRLEAEKARGALNPDMDSALAARQFMGLVKEPVFWPVMLGAEPLPQDVVIANAVSLFLKAYAGS
ncbi:TetR/AcrR family transcriptional regulator [Oceanicaulis sp. LC35]|uniref:TetR/AcrR family transcriptional regulator n=1 Tax=Oceanicaulis sp. LC35 TaxID=3349635 RepID=UPI003F82785E